jgi:hypothetical protein
MLLDSLLKLATAAGKASSREITALLANLGESM